MSQSVQNRNRGRLAENAIDTHSLTAGNDGDNFEENLSDLLCNLMHTCDMHEHETSFDRCLIRGRENYEIEAEENHPPAESAELIQALQQIAALKYSPGDADAKIQQLHAIAESAIRRARPESR